MVFGTAEFMTFGLWLRRMGASAILCLIFALPAHAQLDTIIKQLELQGETRVIVRMSEAAADQSWETAATTVEQRSVVRAMRRQLEAALSDYDLVVEQSFSSLPFVGVA